MAGSAQQPHDLTIADYDRFVAVQADDREWELVEGELVMMSNPTEDHEQIAGNIGAPLKLAMDAIGCRSYQGGLRVQRSDDSRGRDKTKPNIVVRCGPRQNQTYVTDPLVVVEVLSPSTIDHDRGGKLKFYKSLPTLRHIALVYQDQMRVEHYERTDEGWRLEVLTAPIRRCGSTRSASRSMSSACISTCPCCGRSRSAATRAETCRPEKERAPAHRAGAPLTCFASRLSAGR